MTPGQFKSLIAEIAGASTGKPLDAALAAELNRRFPANGAAIRAIDDACHAAIKAGWMCNREAGGIKYGRVVKADDPSLRGFSVDVVHMKDVKGPHHRHPNGEIDLVLPVTPAAKFDGHGAGFVVYGPDSAHHPTVSDGEALVLYLLPGGAIEFTRG
jgi:hypothetical protein